MELTPVKSSNIKAIGYDKKQRVLFIEFYSGEIYEYSEVSKSTYEDFLDSKSLGKYFHINIKNKYSTKKVKIGG